MSHTTTLLHSFTFVGLLKACFSSSEKAVLSQQLFTTQEEEGQKAIPLVLEVTILFCSEDCRAPLDFWRGLTERFLPRGRFFSRFFVSKFLVEWWFRKVGVKIFCRMSIWRAALCRTMTKSLIFCWMNYWVTNSKLWWCFKWLKNQPLGGNLTQGNFLKHQSVVDR